MARCICIAYNGKWTKHNKYLDHETKLILVNDEITYEGLVEKICLALKLKRGEIEANIWFDAKLETSKGMLVTNDEEVTTCFYLLKNDSNFKNSRFIVDVAERKSLPSNSSETKLCNSIVHEEVNIVPQEDGLWEMHIEKDEALLVGDEALMVVEPTKEPEYPTKVEITEETGKISNEKKDGALIADADEAFKVVEPTMEPEYPTTVEITEGTGQTSNEKKDGALIADEAKMVEPTVEPECPTTVEITEETGQTSNEKKDGASVVDEAFKVVEPTAEPEYPPSEEIIVEMGQTSDEKKDEAFKVFEPTFELEAPTTKEITEETGQTSNVKKGRKRSISKRGDSPTVRSISRRYDSPTVVLREDASLDEIVAGSIFENKESLKKCFSNIANEYHFKLKVDKGTKRLYYLKCNDDECNWHVYSSRVRDSSLFRISQFEKNHSCSLDVLPEQPQPTSEEVSEYIIEFLRDTKAEIRPKFVVDEMKRRYGLSISYHKAWRAIQLALGVIRGSAKKNPELCPACLHEEESNPETSTNI